jgi:hypothetical protein
MMQLIKELQDRGFDVPTSIPVIHCRLFEDNSGNKEKLVFSVKNAALALVGLVGLGSVQSQLIYQAEPA